VFESPIERRSKFSPVRLLVSGLVHAAALLLAISLQFSSPTAPRPMQAQSITLVAPRPPQVKLAVPRLRSLRTGPKPTSSIVSPVESALTHPAAVEPAVVRTTPRAFSAPPLPQAFVRKLTIEVEVPEQKLAVAAPSLTANLPQGSIAPPPIVVGKLGAATVAGATSRTGAVRNAGFEGNGVSNQEASAVRSVAASGFGGGRSLSEAPQPDARVTRAAGFGSAAVASGPQRKVAESEPATKAVEILSKPRPAYSAEARDLHLEGEVLLDVLFRASGEARVERVVRGLGHGLDEAAIASVAHIRFHPAERAGQMIDQRATVHIVFQLAY
jgi:TonB family protein